MAGGSKKVVILAGLANGGISIAKFVAYVFTGSGSMLAESIHSAADTGNQLLLLIGSSRAAKPADDRHPLGYSREAYFWALLVAMILFALGGLFSLYEGSHKLMHPEPIKNLSWAFGVLGFSLLLEGASTLAAWKVCKKVRGDKSLFEWAKVTGECELLVVMFEDLAATAGLLIALTAVSLSAVTGDPMYDAIGTLVLGVLLFVVAIFLAMQVRRLIVGSAVEADKQESIKVIWREHGFVVPRMIAVWCGSGAFLIAMKVRSSEPRESTAALVKAINTAERAVRKAHPEVRYQFVEPDTEA